MIEANFSRIFFLWLILFAVLPLNITWASEAEEEPMISPKEAASQPVVEDLSEPAPAKPTETAEQTPSKSSDLTFSIMGEDLPPGTTRALDWHVNHSDTEFDAPNRILVSNGAKPGPTICITAAIHGDEINGIEIVRRVVHNIEAEELAGRLIGVPIVNRDGFRRSSRYLSDRRDLNRHFPGSPSGSAASRLAYALFHDVIGHCDYLIDIHTGSFHRINIPQLRADLSRPEVRKFTKGFGGIIVLDNEGAVGTLRRAAMDAGIPAVTIEAGGPLHLDKAVVDYGTKAIENVLHTLEMRKLMRFWLTPKPTYYQSTWIRAESSGILISVVSLGDKVSKNSVLGEVIDPISNRMQEIRAPFDGQILGMALDQFVSPGYAVYRIGIEAQEDHIKTKENESKGQSVPVDMDPDLPND